jgi:hypothetical protein
MAVEHLAAGFDENLSPFPGQTPPKIDKEIYMEHENEIRSLSAETLAMSIVLANLFSRFARIPTLRLAIAVGFDQSVDMAEDITSMFGKSAPPDHMVKTLRLVEEMRAMVLGDGGKPKDLV